MDRGAYAGIEILKRSVPLVSRTFQLSVMGGARVKTAAGSGLRECLWLLGILVPLLAGTLAWAEEPAQAPSAPAAVRSISPPTTAQDDSSAIPSIRLRGSVWRMKADIGDPQHRKYIDICYILRDKNGSEH